MRLDKLVAHLGYGSRKQVKTFIRKGLILVNGEIVRNDDAHVDPDVDEILFLDESLNYESLQYFLLNKPKDTICSRDRSLYPSVLDLFNENLLPSTQVVGRLDVDTTGVLLITNDGQLAHHLLSPKHHVKKVYHVSLKKVFDVSFIPALEKGIKINNDEVCLPAQVKVIDVKHIELVLVEGKYHQVKRMMHACNNEVINLHRVSFGTLQCDDLKVGEYRSLTDEEIETLKLM